MKIHHVILLLILIDGRYSPNTFMLERFHYEANPYWLLKWGVQYISEKDLCQDGSLSLSNAHIFSHSPLTLYSELQYAICMTNNV